MRDKAKVEVGELVFELVEGSSMLDVSIAELYFEPMDPSLSRLKFFHACA